MRKLTLSITLLFLIGFAGSILAQEAELPKPGLTPDSFFYVFDTLGERIGMFFTLGAEKKAEKALNYAEEKLAEVKAMAEKNKTEPLEGANQKYQGYLNLANQKTQEAKAKGRDVEELAVLLTEATLKHQDALVKVFELVPEEAKTGIKKAIEISSKGSEQAVEGVENPEKKEELLLKMQAMTMKMEQTIMKLEERLKVAEARIKELEEKLRKEAPFSVVPKSIEIPAIGVPPEPPKKCIGEGEEGGLLYDICCLGLNKIANSWPADNQCMTEMHVSFICTYCGNGVCEKGENVCNCPQDCKIIENLPPVIDGLEAPSQLQTGKEGIWGIKAHDPEGGPLSYSVDWGEYLPMLKEMAPPEKIIQTATFSHTYTKSGTYTIKFTITDDHQQTAKTSVTVVVIPEAVEKSITVISPNGGERWEIGKTYDIVWQAKNIEKVDIFLLGCSNSECAFPSSHAIVPHYTIDAKTGIYSWYISSDLGWYISKYPFFKVRIGEAYPGPVDGGITEIKDESDNYFSIVKVIACADSDGGKNYYLKGTCTDMYGTYTESCYVNAVREYYCGDVRDICDLTYAPCPYGCQDGACKQGQGITVISPNGGEKFQQGADLTITWESKGVDYVNIDLQDWGRKQEDGSTPFILDLVNNYPALKGTYTWKIYSDWPTGNLYKIKIESAGKIVAEDSSDNYFSIVQPSVTVLNPNGGEKWVAGNTYEITWGSLGIDRVKIYECAETPLLTTKYTCHLLSAIPDAGILNTGSHSWYVDPNDPFLPGQIKIKVEDASDPLIFDESDSYFSIVARE